MRSARGACSGGRAIGPSETSPVVSRASIFVGDWDGRVWALRRKTGKTRWVTKLQGQVKGAVAISGNRIFVGDYSGHLYALSYASGKVLWKAKLQPRFGGAGNIYATPSAAYGRVYVGATDGKVYSFGAESGKLRWSQSTGGYVYSSTAVWRDRVYAGSYSKRFFCFDAATGKILWQFTANGQISGAPTVIAGRVYFATLAGRTYALDARSGALLWTFPDGKYSPVVADSKRLYLIGYARIYGLVPSATQGTVTAQELRRIPASGHPRHPLRLAEGGVDARRGAGVQRRPREARREPDAVLEDRPGGATCLCALGSQAHDGPPIRRGARGRPRALAPRGRRAVVAACRGPRDRRDRRRPLLVPRRHELQGDRADLARPADVAGRRARARATAPTRAPSRRSSRARSSRRRRRTPPTCGRPRSAVTSPSGRSAAPARARRARSP